jgi:hypothetical protein
MAYASQQRNKNAIGAILIATLLNLARTRTRKAISNQKEPQIVKASMAM